MIKEYYKDTVQKTIKKLEKYNDCFKMALIADTHIDNSVRDSAENICAVDKFADFSCLIHLGDFLNGNIPKRYSDMILKEQFELFKNCISNKNFFPVQGNHDGYCDLTKEYSPNMAIDEDWYSAIKFTENCSGVRTEKNKPYYYVDFPERKLRLIILCTFFYKGFYDGKPYDKVYGTDLEQIEWLKYKALNVSEDWKVMIFSHDAPTEHFDEDALENNPRVNGTLLVNTVKEKMRECGFKLPAWFVGHFHGDYIGKIAGINFILVASETAYVPQLWDMPDGGYYPDRILGSSTEDLWDALVLDEQNQKIRLFRFGAGKDRELDY